MRAGGKGIELVCFRGCPNVCVCVCVCVCCFVGSGRSAVQHVVVVRHRQPDKRPESGHFTWYRSILLCVLFQRDSSLTCVLFRSTGVLIPVAILLVLLVLFFLVKRYSGWSLACSDKMLVVLD